MTTQIRIGIDAHFTSYELRGIGKYILNLILELGALEVGHRFLIYGNPRNFPALPGDERFSFRDPGNCPYPFWEQVTLPRWAESDKVDVLHCPANTAPVLLSPKISLVVTIHDVMYLLPASKLKPSKVLRQQLGNFYRRCVVPPAVRRATRCIALSEYSKREILEHLPVSADDIRVIHGGIRLPATFTLETDVQTEALKPQHILALGSGDPRKNTKAIIHAFAQARPKLPPGVELLILGLRDWRNSKVRSLACELGVIDFVRFADYVSEAELHQSYASALCFLYPSLYEGFGFPVLEAMSFGVPVITSSVTCLPEVAGDAALFVDPEDSHAIADALIRVVSDRSLASNLVIKGQERVKAFQWRNTAVRTMETYEAAVRR